MRRILLYGGTLVAAWLLISISERWFGAEWIFGLATVALFALFLQSWKRWGRGGSGLVIVTAFLLLTLDSIFFVQYLPAFICSLLMGLLLVPYHRKHRDGIVASMVFVLLNMLIALVFVPSELMLWLIVILTGTAALIGFRFNLPLVKSCFTVLFSLASFFLLLFQLVDDLPIVTVLAFAVVIAYLVSMYRMKPVRGA